MCFQFVIYITSTDVIYITVGRSTAINDAFTESEIWFKIEFHLIQNRKENYHHDYIPFNVKGNGNIVFAVQSTVDRN